MKKLSYVGECTKASHFLMIDKDDMDSIIGAIKWFLANLNQIALRANKSEKIYDEDIAEMKAKLEEIWQLLNCIRSGVQCVNHLNTLLTKIRPEIIRLSELLCVRQNQSEQQSNFEPSENVSEVDEAPPKPNT